MIKWAAQLPQTPEHCKCYSRHNVITVTQSGQQHCTRAGMAGVIGFAPLVRNWDLEWWWQTVADSLLMYLTKYQGTDLWPTCHCFRALLTLKDVRYLHVEELFIMLLLVQLWLPVVMPDVIQACGKRGTTKWYTWEASRFWFMLFFWTVAIKKQTLKKGCRVAYFQHTLFFDYKINSKHRSWALLHLLVNQLHLPPHLID